MSRARAAWSLWTLAMAMLVSGLALSAASGAPVDGIFSYVAVFPITASLGALIFARVPRNPIGWIFLGTGLLGGLSAVLAGNADSALLAGAGSSGLGHTCAWITRALWAPTTLAPVTFALLLFPDGRLPTRRWRFLLWFAGVGIVALSIFVGLSTENESWRGEDNPRVEDPAGPLIAVLGALSAAVVPAVIGAVAAVIVRFRRSHGEERQQLKWLAYGGGVAAVVLLVLGIGFDEGGVWVGVVIGAALSLIPISISIAILRHRLYDIDVVINRTLVYAGLTATLAGMYLGLVLLFQLALSPLTEDSDLAIAGSTLAVAALFRPVRARIQATVDQRFYRARYDAARTLQRFGARLRDQVELEALTADLRSVVANTMHPARVSVWLRDPEAPR